MNLRKLYILTHLHYLGNQELPFLRLKTTQEAFEELKKDGLLEATKTNGNQVDITPKGVAYLELVMETPLPQPAWIHPVTKKVIGT